MKDNKIVAIVLVIIIVAAAALYVIQRRNATVPSVTLSTNYHRAKPEVKTAPPGEAGKNTLTMETQKPNSSVTVQEVSFADTAGYVVIHKDEDGRPGLIIGHSALLHIGNSQNTVITLTTPLVDKNSYFAMLHKDNGDGVYNIIEDQPLRDEGDNIIMTKFDALLIPTSEEQAPSQSAAKTYIIEMNENSFSPATLSIKKDDIVKFINRGSTDMWPASAVHPAHEACPGFDALQGIAPGSSYSHTFTLVKDCPFHDHLTPSLRGKIS